MKRLPRDVVSLGALLHRLVIVAGVLVAVADRAGAQGGVNLAWDDCGASGSSNQNFACDTNAGVSTLYGSGILPVAAPHCFGQISEVDVFGAAFQLPNWWQLATGGCRSLTPSVVAGDYDFSSNTRCVDPWAEVPTSGVQVSSASGYVRIRLFGQTSQPTALNATDEYYFFKLVISHAATVGNGSCSGCTTGVCFYLPAIELFVASGDPVASIYHGLNNLAFWQGARYGSECTTATRPTTWGGVKSLYR